MIPACAADTMKIFLKSNPIKNLLKLKHCLKKVYPFMLKRLISRQLLRYIYIIYNLVLIKIFLTILYILYIL